MPEHYIKTLIKDVPDGMEPTFLAQRVQEVLTEHLDVGAVFMSFYDNK